MAAMHREPVRSGLSPLYYLHLAAVQVQDLLAEAMATSPLDPAEYALYSLIFESGQTTATRLADEARVPLTTMLDTVRSLERRGHVQRRPDPRDRCSWG
jgi:DNA-binding MarR family transcriptional regulator